MAISFNFHQKKERNLIISLVVVLALGGLIVGFFLKKSPVELVFEALKPPAPKINWDTLDDPRLEKLLPLQEIPLLTEGWGRKNPFLPY